MVHTVVDLLSAWSTGVCEVHGTSAEACGASQELATLGSSLAVGSSIGAAVGRGRGAAVGGMLGLVVGAYLNGLDEPAHG